MRYLLLSDIHANADAFDGWPDSTRDVLRSAIADTKSFATTLVKSDAQLADAYCDVGGTVSVASNDQLDQWRQPVGGGQDERAVREGGPQPAQRRYGDGEVTDAQRAQGENGHG